jgi:hypothetical protein
VSGYGCVVGGELTVRVPRDLSWDLVDEGFEQAGQLRGLDWLSQGATIAVTVAGAAADLTTLILAKDSVVQFVHRIAAWATGQTKNSGSNQLTLRLAITHPGDTESDHYTEIIVTRSGQFSDVDVLKAVSFLTAAFDDDATR